jgi:hypothetical protein
MICVVPAALMQRRSIMQVLKTADVFPMNLKIVEAKYSIVLKNRLLPHNTSKL